MKLFLVGFFEQDKLFCIQVIGRDSLVEGGSSLCRGGRTSFITIGILY